MSKTSTLALVATSTIAPAVALNLSPEQQHEGIRKIIAGRSQPQRRLGIGALTMIL